MLSHDMRHLYEATCSQSASSFGFWTKGFRADEVRQSRLSESGSPACRRERLSDRESESNFIVAFELALDQPCRTLETVWFHSYGDYALKPTLWYMYC